jgi:hypothetical protein
MSVAFLISMMTPWGELTPYSTPNARYRESAPRRGLTEELPEHELQNTAMLVVLQFLGRINPADRLDSL